MSTPEGPARRDRDGSEVEQTGEIPTWGTSPPGGWGDADPQTPTSSRAVPPQGHDAASGTGSWAQTGGAGETGSWAPNGGAGQTGSWAATGGAGETGSWAPADWTDETGSRAAGGTGSWAATGGSGETGSWAPTGGAGETGSWAPAGDPGQTVGRPPGGGTGQAGGWPTDPGTGNPEPAAGWDEGGWDDGRGGVPEQGGRQPVWGDEATVATPAPGGRRRRAEEPDDGWGDPDPAASPGQQEQFAPGEEPWAPNEAVRPPRRGPFGLAPAALAGIGAGVVVLAVLAVLAFVAPGFAVTSTLDKTALQNGVTQVLTQNYKLQVGSVDCPDDVEASTGTAFACQALVDGEQVSVPGQVTSDEGDYQVGRV